MSYNNTVRVYDFNMDLVSAADEQVTLQSTDMSRGIARNGHALITRLTHGKLYFFLRHRRCLHLGHSHCSSFKV